jgi:transcriptional regulator with XRE-family HTH domain
MVMPNEKSEYQNESRGKEPVFGSPTPADATAPLHRIAEVRRQQGVSLRAARQSLGLTSEHVQRQEQENYDLLLSELYKWQDVLDVPVTELLVEPNRQLSQPISKRAMMIKVMKTAATILEAAQHPETKALAQRLVEQLLEIMPELEGVSAWPSVGQRRSLDEMGRIAQHPLSLAPLEDY